MGLRLKRYPGESCTFRCGGEEVTVTVVEVTKWAGRQTKEVVLDISAPRTVDISRPDQIKGKRDGTDGETEPAGSGMSEIMARVAVAKP